MVLSAAWLGGDAAAADQGAVRFAEAWEDGAEADPRRAGALGTEGRRLERLVDDLTELAASKPAARGWRPDRCCRASWSRRAQQPEQEALGLDEVVSTTPLPRRRTR